MFNFGKQVTEPVKVVGNVLDKLFTSDDERLNRAEIMAKIQQAPQIAQIELNKIEAKHSHIFVAGWRPFIGWVCGFNLVYLVLIRDWMCWLINACHLNIVTPPAIGIEMTTELVFALLGLGGLRTFEKIKGKA